MQTETHAKPEEQPTAEHSCPEYPAAPKSAEADQERIEGIMDNERSVMQSITEYYHDSR